MKKEYFTQKDPQKYLRIKVLGLVLGLASILGFFLFSTSDPDAKVSGRENQGSEAGEAGNPSQKAVAGNEVEGEKGQG